MANVLKMTIVEAIHSLRSAGLSRRAIAKRLGIHRETVSRYLQLGRDPVSKPANAPISPAGTSGPVAGFEAPTGSAVAGFGVPTGSGGRGSNASPWLAWLLEERAKGLTAKRIHQDLLVTFPGAAAVSYDSVRRLLKKHIVAAPVPFRRIESPPGAEAQIDFGTGATSAGMLYTRPMP